MAYFSKLLRAAEFLIMALAVALLLQIDGAAMRAAEALVANSGAWVFAGLALAEIFALVWLYRALFARQSKLVLRLGADEAERTAFLAEMRRRLAANPQIRAAGLSPDAPDFVEQAMRTLDAKAEEEIRSGGRKVFLGTALAQNGRLDALVMFFALARMVWRISAIYNQRPTPREIISVYRTVSSATFVAFSIEALNIPQSIADAINELVPSVTPAMAAASVPFVGPAMHVFTTSVIDGAANCLLAVRAGVITRRAYRYAMYGGEESLRRSCLRETAGILMDITQESVGAIVKAMKKEVQELSLNSGRKLADQAGRVTDMVTSSVTDAASGVAKAAADTAGVVGAGAQAVGSTLLEGAQAMGNTVMDGAQTVGSAVVSGGRAVVGTASEGAQKVAATVRDGTEALGATVRAVGGALGDAGKETLSLVQRTGRGLWGFFSGGKRR